MRIGRVKRGPAVEPFGRANEVGGGLREIALLREGRSGQRGG